jgi:hypothetical protein
MLEVNANPLQPFADEEVSDSSVKRRSKNHFNHTMTKSNESSQTENRNTSGECLVSGNS